MIEMITQCPFCNSHEVDVGKILLHIAVSQSRDVEIATIPVNLCPWSQRDLDKSKSISARRIKHNLHITLHKLIISGDVFIRIIFSIPEGKYISDRLSIDKAVVFIDQLKNTLLTHMIEASRIQEKDDKVPQKTREQLILKLINRKFKTFYRALRRAR